MSEVLIERISRFAGEANTKATVPRKGVIVVEVEQTKLKEFISHVVSDLRILHLSTISGLDLGQNIGIVYHFWQGRDMVHVKTTVPKTNPTATSIVDLVPGAVLYEMEVHDMFGIAFAGNPWMNKKLLLPDSWPADLAPPLLKSSNPEEIRKRLQLEVERK